MADSNKILDRIVGFGNSNKGQAVDVSSDVYLAGREFTFRVGVGGTIVVDYKGGSKGVALLNCPDGSYHPNPVEKIVASGTTVTDVVIYL